MLCAYGLKGFDSFFFVDENRRGFPLLIRLILKEAKKKGFDSASA